MQKEKEYTEDEIANIFFEQTIFETINGMTRMLKDIKNINSKINKLKLFPESEDLDEELPNVGITLNNKIVEIYQLFKTYGIKIFYGYDEKNGISINGIIPAFIIENLNNDYLLPLIEKMTEYVTTAKVMKTIKETNEEEMQKKGPIGKTIMLFKAMINSNDSIYFEEDELDVLRKYLIEYKKINEDIYNYNLKDNLIEAILKHFESSNKSFEEIQEMMINTIEPMLIKLELKDKIQELSFQINKHFQNRKKKDWELSESEKQGLQEVPGNIEYKEYVVEDTISER